MEKLVRRSWVIFIIALIASLGFEFFYHPHGSFGIDGTRLFNAWYGFVTCVAMVFGAKLLGVFLKKPENYYNKPEQGDD